MSREVYIPKNFRGDARAMIDQGNAIIAEYQAAGFKLTLRQLYYQHVARGLFSNTLENYKLLGRTMVNARDAGESDWDAIEDRTRAVLDYAVWDNPHEFVVTESERYREDLWDGQGHRVDDWRGRYGV